MTAPTNAQCRCRGQCGSVHPMIGCPRRADAASKRRLMGHYEPVCRACAAGIDKHAPKTTK